ncbi:MAG: right-handed parallel beta-helix repeat-containing protein [Gammaproteobacteria bacterium]
MTKVFPNTLVGTGLALALLPLLLLSGCGSGESNSTQSSCTQNYWVSTTGNDTSGDGSESAPFRTLEHARQIVSANPKRGQCTLNVNVEPGTYALAAPLKFAADDSGSAPAPVIYQAAPEATAPVVISGGMPVTLACKGNKCIGSVPDLPPHTLPRQFYVNGARAIRARSNPLGPLENPDEQVNLNYIRVPSGYQQILPETLTNPKLVEAVTMTQWKMMRCPVAKLSDTTLVMAEPCWHNANTYPVLWNFQLLSWLENAPEFLQDPLTGDYIPNFWYLDPHSKQLTWINTGSAPPRNAVLPVLQNLVEVEGTSSAPVTNIIFKGLQFSYATWMGPNPAGWQGQNAPSTGTAANGYVADQSGNLLQGTGYKPNVIGHQKTVYKTPGNITLRNASHITFENDTFAHLGAVALELDSGSQDIDIENNTFTDISSSAIEAGGFTQQAMRPNSAQKVSNITIANNNISYTGRDYYDSAGIFVAYTTGTTITHNTINHTPWSSIAIGWGWGLFDPGSFPGLPGATSGMWGQYDTPTIMSNNKITHNLFENFLEKLWDGGAIYANGAQGPDFAHGLLIEENVAVDKRSAAGSNIYYTDGGTSYVTLKQNVSLYNPVGTVNFGPCTVGSIIVGSAIIPECALTGITSYGADMGGCLPVGHLKYIQNYFEDTLTFFGPQLCHNDEIPPYPIDLTFNDNHTITSLAEVPGSILDQAGVQ